MPTAQFIHDGDAIDHVPASDVAAGDVVVRGDLVAIAKLDIPAGTLGALAVTGVFDVAKASGDGGIATGQEVRFNTDDAVAQLSDEKPASQLDGDILAGETSLAVADGSVFSVGDKIRIDSEVMRVTAVDGDDLTVIRGYLGAAAGHNDGAMIDRVDAYPLMGKAIADAADTDTTVRLRLSG